MKAIFPVIGLLLLSSFGLRAQSGNAGDSLAVNPPETLRPVAVKWQPEPKKALMWAIIPGGGQIYNRRWWKAPIVYGATYGMYRVVDYNQGLYRRFKKAYLAKLNDEPHEFTGTTIDNIQTLRNLRDRYDKKTQNAYVYFALLYVLQGIEAYVDAHLQGFDVNEDIGFHVRPVLSVDPVLAQPSFGVGIVIPIGK